jgi:hypothetical protein
VCLPELDEWALELEEPDAAGFAEDLTEAEDLAEDDDAAAAWALEAAGVAVPADELVAEEVAGADEEEDVAAAASGLP